MPDYFQLLGLPPMAALDEETLQAAYLTATRAAHPDQAGGDTALSAELNAALETLRSPATRLKNLLEHHSNTPWRAIPLDSALMTVFEKLGPLLQQSGAFLKKKQAATTALAKALLSSEEMRLRETLEGLNEQIEELWQALESHLPGLEGQWQELQAVQARFAYLVKWRSQIREVLLGLML